MIFFIETNTNKKNAIEFEKDLTLFLEKMKQKITKNIEDCDIILSLGGDGTFIRAVNKYRNYNKGILGINCGTLGYLTELTPFNYKEKLLKLLKGTYSINKRIGIVGNIKNKTYEACNDIIIRNNSMNIISFDVFVDNIFLSSFKADGIIVSTPIGSTGYSLSCGGSFIDPNSKNILINLISPHTLMNRSIVLNSDSEIRIIIKDINGDTDVAIDGDIISRLQNNEEIIIKQSDNPSKIIEIEKTSFIENISKKLST